MNMKRVMRQGMAALALTAALAGAGVSTAVTVYAQSSQPLSQVLVGDTNTTATYEEWKVAFNDLYVDEVTPEAYLGKLWTDASGLTAYDYYLQTAGETATFDEFVAQQAEPQVAYSHWVREQLSLGYNHEDVTVDNFINQAAYDAYQAYLAETPEEVQSQKDFIEQTEQTYHEQLTYNTFQAVQSQYVADTQVTPELYVTVMAPDAYGQTDYTEWLAVNPEGTPSEYVSTQGDYVGELSVDDLFDELPTEDTEPAPAPVLDLENLPENGEVPFETIELLNDTIPEGEREIVVEGINGLTENGVLVTAPQDEIVVIGTGIAVEEDGAVIETEETEDEDELLIDEIELEESTEAETVEEIEDEVADEEVEDGELEVAPLQVVSEDDVETLAQAEGSVDEATNTEIIEYEIEYIDDPTLPVGELVEETPGRNGRRVNGVVVEPAQNQVYRIGVESSDSFTPINTGDPNSNMYRPDSELQYGDPNDPLYDALNDPSRDPSNEDSGTLVDSGDASTLGLALTTLMGGLSIFKFKRKKD